jgi:hypothetical protein
MQDEYGNDQRAERAREAVRLFASLTGNDDEREALRDLATNLLHLWDRIDDGTDVASVCGLFDYARDTYAEEVEIDGEPSALWTAEDYGRFYRSADSIDHRGRA